MPTHRYGDRLSWGDTVFLYLEREGMPLHIGSALLFEGVISVDALCGYMDSKLPLIPRYLQRVVAPPFNIGLPTWEYDPNFDLRNHVREVTLNRGTHAEFKAVAGKIFSQMMDRQRPLWDLTLVRGLQGSRTGLIFRIHHCLADGIAGVGIMNVIMDANPAAPCLPKKKGKLRAPPPRDPLATVLEGLLSSYSNIVERLLTTQTDMLTIAERVAAGGRQWPSGELARLLPEITAPTQPLRFNVTCRGPQKVAWARIPLADVKAIREKYGASVNDVLLALVTSTIRRYVEMHKDPVKKQLLRIMVPVNVRGNGKADDLGNRISLLPFTIPLDIRNPRNLLLAVHERTEFLKRAHIAEVVSLAGGLIGVIATPLQALAGPVASQLPIAPFNMVCTNVPGPQLPLYLLGHKMVSWYPYVPVGGEMAMNCAMLSYDGTIYLGFSGDVHAAPDLRRLEGLMQLSFAELRDAARTRPQRQKRTRPKIETVVKPAPAPVGTVPLAIPLRAVGPPPPPPPATNKDQILASVSA